MSHSSFLQAFRSSINDQQAIPPSYSPRDILALALSQGALDGLSTILARAAYDPNTSVQGIAQVIASLERVGIDFSGARAALASAVARHCVRCHRTYRDRENGPNACVIYHQSSDDTHDLGNTGLYPCLCQGMSAMFGVVEATGECYRGWHTDKPEQVDYISSSAIPCDGYNCGSNKPAFA
ncbi:uncharacterized protein C8Q71DRAFT_776101 [Rhodofomes roseus]|uniref:Uncharacterized protein n=1 Tax=Rhodofomes roseus TaxID=34475 RepID=A0ABQ8K7A7_9APHY|nr:uncharacterized protein C8Q71DRAFT_776101 [Rhodofomes roseus]KAH9833034.1 hypothetical protein C8Q71DRAFT_776101 [Rhodofomes roseus]